VPPLFEEIAERGAVEPAEMYEVFNMGCGFCCVVPPGDADEAASILARRHPGTAVIGRASTAAGVVELPRAGLRGTREGFTPA
jgi:phosphoribosylformylglycinamidine cyclo-ligase